MPRYEDYDTGIRFYIEDSYRYMDHFPEDDPGISTYLKMTDCSYNLIFLEVIDGGDAMPFDDPDRVIRDLRAQLRKDQGLVEVNSGVTRSGRRYIYSIIKMKSELSGGVMYKLCMHVDEKDCALSVTGNFEEAWLGEDREALVFEMQLKRRPGGIISTCWAQDPYDPGYGKGLLRNLSENREYDTLFPTHPLSQARRFVDFVRIYD